MQYWKHKAKYTAGGWRRLNGYFGLQNYELPVYLHLFQYFHKAIKCGANSIHSVDDNFFLVLNTYIDFVVAGLKHSQSVDLSIFLLQCQYILIFAVKILTTSGEARILKPIIVFLERIGSRGKILCGLRHGISYTMHCRIPSGNGHSFFLSLEFFGNSIGWCIL